MTLQKISACLWFDNQAEEAVNYYVSIFQNSKVKKIARYSEAGAKVSGRPKDSVMSIAFELEGQEFLALNGGPIFTFSPAISFMVNCKTQEEIDYFWDRLSDGGQPSQCAWLTDKYGITWQIVPEILGELMSGPPEKAQKTMHALLQMTKLDIKTLQEAYNS